MMFPQCFAPASLCCICAQWNFIEYNRFAADQTLGLYSPQENKNVNAAVSGCGIPRTTGDRARCWSLHGFSCFVMCQVSLLH